ncbi:hypothetical protein FQN49_005259 [Arthroderma sp. PD_2]|nr:hypothetical protein FQN49_005259 [Arthroderma sp. PD_2]
MKGTPAELALPNLFVGKTKTYISCINVDYESSRIEDFWDIQLSVKGNRTLDDSFRSYINVEIMDGENKYDAGPPHGLQDARKGVIFESFPPVLHLHLQRYEYDFNRDAMMKINDRHEFPEEFDAAPYLSADADMSEPWEYKLFGVLVHSGDLNAGHYYAFLRPTKDGQFYKFDDDRVIKATAKETLEENFGGEYANGGDVRQPYTRNYSTKRSMNAYMLVYIRKSKISDVLVDVVNEDVPTYLAKQVDEERAEVVRRKKERDEQHLYINIGVVTDESIKHHHGFDLTSSDLEQGNPALPTSYRVRRNMKVGEFAELVAEDRSLDPGRVRLWAMVNRQNKTVRPDQPLREPEDTVEDAAIKQASRGHPFRVYLEVAEPGEDGKVTWPERQGPNASVLVILKHFDAATQTLSGMGHIYVKKQSKVSELAGPILEMMNWPAGTSFSLFEEIKPSMIDQLKPKQTFQASEIGDGDVICFQRTQSDAEYDLLHSTQLMAAADLNTNRLGPSILYKDARQYYDYLLNRVMIKFAPVKAESEDATFTLALSRKMNYEQFSTKVGEHLKVDPTHLRFAPVATNTGNPKAFIRRNVSQTLSQILNTQYSAYGNAGQRSDALYYEILETSLSEYETKKLMKITWLPEGIIKEQPHELLVPKQGNVIDILQGLQQKAGLDDETMTNVRVFEAHYCKMQKELTDKFGVAGITDSISLYAEPIPEDERNMQEGDFRINAFNYDKEPNREHGIPFSFVVKPGEKFIDTKERLSKRTGIRGKQFEKIKFAVVTRTMYSNPTYLEDDDILADLVGDTDSQLGLNHVNKNRNFLTKSDNIFIR